MLSARYDIYYIEASPVFILHFLYDINAISLKVRSCTRSDMKKGPR